MSFADDDPFPYNSVQYFDTRQHLWWSPGLPIWLTSSRLSYRYKVILYIDASYSGLPEWCMTRLYGDSTFSLSHTIHGCPYGSMTRLFGNSTLSLLYTMPSWMTGCLTGCVAGYAAFRRSLSHAIVMTRLQGDSTLSLAHVWHDEVAR